PRLLPPGHHRRRRPHHRHHRLHRRRHDALRTPPDPPLAAGQPESDGTTVPSEGPQEVWRSRAPATSGHVTRGRPWPMPGRVSRVAPGISALDTVELAALPDGPPGGWRRLLPRDRRPGGVKLFGPGPSNLPWPVRCDVEARARGPG